MAPRPLVVSIAVFGVIAAACQRRSAPTPPAPAATPPAGTPTPAPPPPAPPPEPAAEDPGRFVAFDRENLRRHVALLAFARKARAQLEKAARQQQGSKAGSKHVLALQASQQKSIAAQAQALHTMDPEGNRSYLTAAHETNLQYLGDEYPAAIIGALNGDLEPLAELRTEMDKVEKQIEDWLRQVRQADTKATAGK
jgi:hypothetical protein